MLQAPIRYFSTNEAIFGKPDLEARIADGSLKAVDLGTAIIQGQAPDGGLYMPTHFPQISLDTIARMKDMSYAQVFVEVMKDFFHDVLSESTLERIAHEAYEGNNPFEPFIEQISEIDFIGRLDEGPTATFKDYAAQVLFRIIEALMKEQPKIVLDTGSYLRDADLLTFIVATSGDTGGAMGHAVLNRNKMWMAILHSAFLGTEISDLQAKQMDNLGSNAYAIWVKTNFDGCQEIVKQLLKDPELKYMNPNSANSINIGRLIPQIAYYFYIHPRVAEHPKEQIVFSVPTGNAGDIVAGLFAIRMGLPAKVIAGVNENDVIERFYRTGIYSPAEKTIVCPSNAMIITWPSNMRRWFQLYQGQLIEGKDPDDPKRTIIEKLVAPNLHLMRQEIIGAYRVSNEETLYGIKKFWEEMHMIGSLHSTTEPHTEVGRQAAQKFRRQTGYKDKMVVLGTGHPAKSPEYLLDMGIKPLPPTALYRLQNRPHGRHFEVENDYNAVKDLIMQLHRQELAKYK